MKRSAYAATLAAMVVMVTIPTFVTPSSGAADDAAPIYGINIPQGYRDWPMISLARVGAPINDLRGKFGNDIAMRAFRDGTRPFPDGTIIARLAYKAMVSEDNNKAFRLAIGNKLSPEEAEKLLNESVVAGDQVNVQFMVKDSRKYAASGGWGFAEFTNGKPSPEAVHKNCFACHTPAKDLDFVFTRYSP